MKFRKFMYGVVLVVMCTCIRTATAGTDPADNDDWTASLKSRVWSKYIGSNGQIFHNDPVNQTDVTIVHSSGLYANLWTSYGLESLEVNDDYGDEIDGSLGLAASTGDFDFDVGVAYFALNNLGLSEDDVWQFYGETSKSFDVTEGITLSPFAHVDYYADAEFSFLEPNFELGTGSSVQLCDSISLNTKLSALYDVGAFGLEAGFIGKLTAGISWSVSKSVKIEIINFKATKSFVEDVRGDEIAIGAGISFAF